MSDADCPYCGAEIEINHDDGYGYNEDQVYEQDCGFCLKTFAYTASISVDHSAHKAECLNGGNHNWEPMINYPKRWPDAKRCKNCGKEDRGEKVEIR